MIKLIATDMDGTLLNNQKELTNDMLALMKDLQKQGVQWVIASGRQYYNMISYFEDMKDQIIFVSENGTYIVQGEKELCVHDLKKEDVYNFVQICEGIEGAYPVVCGKKSAYILHDDPVFINEVQKYYHKCERLNCIEDIKKLDDQILKVAIFCTKGTEELVYPHYKDYVNDYMVSVSAFVWLDIMQKGIHKGAAIQFLQKELSITYDETMLFGDYMNDYEMMQCGYYSYAMKNAHPDLKKVCRFETAFTNDEDGVKKEIEKYLLSSKAEK
ncbi:MAG: Cof-type HAD-IIB family hydrolase [Erysipelotrichaceae bacterium]|nr:Cof-type HAD-IIB family hydrolase [Erysipelotrichaceae bacterium]